MSMYPQPGTRKPFELDYATSDKTMSKFFNVVYAWMAVGLAVTAAVAYFVSQSDVGLRMVYRGGRRLGRLLRRGQVGLPLGGQLPGRRHHPPRAHRAFLRSSRPR